MKGNVWRERGRGLDPSSLVVQSERICLQCRRAGFGPWLRKMPWRREWLPTPVFLPEHPMDRGARRAAVHAVSRVGHD